MLRLDGGCVYVEIAATPLLFRGQPSVQAVIRDVTERRRAALAQARLAAVVEASQDAILSVTAEGTVVGWNPAAERLYGWAEEEASGRAASVTTPRLQAFRSGAALRVACMCCVSYVSVGGRAGLFPLRGSGACIGRGREAGKAKAMVQLP